MTDTAMLHVQMGMTALIFAIVRGTEEIVDLLLERGADVKTKDTVSSI